MATCKWCGGSGLVKTYNGSEPCNRCSGASKAKSKKKRRSTKIKIGDWVEVKTRSGNPGGVGFVQSSHGETLGLVMLSGRHRAVHRSHVEFLED